MIKALRLYTFVNFYLSSIQQGIQSTHVATELSNIYRSKKTLAAKLLHSWEEHGKTIIVLNGGMACDIANSFDAAESFDSLNRYPMAAFYEEPGAIHESRQAITAWGIVLPAIVYEAKPTDALSTPTSYTANIADAPAWKAGTFEYFICSHLQGKALAR